MINKRMNKLAEFLTDSGYNSRALRFSFDRKSQGFKACESLDRVVNVAVSHGKYNGILPTNWLAWMLIKIAVESWLRRYFNRLWNDVYGVPSGPMNSKKTKLGWGILPVPAEPLKGKK